MLTSSFAKEPYKRDHILQKRPMTEIKDNDGDGLERGERNGGREMGREEWGGRCRVGLGFF